ncbi:hypothetical protein JCM5296_007028 [Sporobolomyces johnsonii]
MPIKRLAEDAGRPPLSRGSACSRCYKRKVRCSGQPDPGSGFHSCDSCRRTARYKGHDVYQARCSFNREGLCSEEGGPTLSGEVYSNAGPAASRKTSSRASMLSSTNSRRSFPPGSSTSTTDYSLRPSQTPSSVSSNPPRNDSAFCQSSEHLHAPSKTFKLPPLIPSQPSPVPSQPPPLPFSAPSFYPHNNSYAPPSANDSPHPPPDPPSHTSASQQSLLGRRAHLQPLHIALPPRPNIVSSSSILSSAAAGPSLPAASISAPLQAPNDWGRQHPSYYLPSQEYSQHYPSSDFNGVPPLPADGPLPPTSLALDLASFSSLTPSTFTKVDMSPFPTYDYAAAPVPSLGFGPSSDFPHDLRSAASFPQSSHPPLHHPFTRAPSTLPHHGGGYYGGFPAAAAGSELAGPDASHPALLSNSFHLASPGLTFTSSTPPWLANHGQGQ